MSEIKKEKDIRLMEITGGVILILYALCQLMFFPYIAAIKAEKGQFKEACAYVVGKEKVKYSYDYYISIDGKIYTHRDIWPYGSIATLKRNTWLKFPLGENTKGLLTIEPLICKKVQYVEVYNIFGFKKFYLYDYLNQQAPKT